MTRNATRTAAIIAFAAGLASCRHAIVPVPATGTLSSDTTNLVARGEYIVRNAAVCGGCHSPNERNPDGPLSGGTEFKDWRLGTIRASNLTPDSATGLGTWTEADIVRAMRSGQTKDGRVLAPVMPYDWLNRMSDVDAFAVARYLKSLPPVRNEVRQSPNLVFKVARLFLKPEAPISVKAPARAPPDDRRRSAGDLSVPPDSSACSPRSEESLTRWRRTFTAELASGT